jgi:hypothetical protein
MNALRPGSMADAGVSDQQLKSSRLSFLQRLFPGG